MNGGLSTLAQDFYDGHSGGWIYFQTGGQNTGDGLPLCILVQGRSTDTRKGNGLRQN
jgi:hypothetical protein